MSRTTFLLCTVAVCWLALAGPRRSIAQEAAATPEKPVELKVGDEAPEFEAVDDAGQPWKSVEHVGKKILVVYFYPKDRTKGCTAQACSYRDAQGKLEDMDVEVVGVSRDTVESHVEFKKVENLNFTLLADPTGVVSSAFGVIQLTKGPLEMASRWTFVIDLDGHIAFKDEKVDPAKDVENVMKVVAKLKEKKAK
jgi:peroxiredoxin Q/BCP